MTNPNIKIFKISIFLIFIIMLSLNAQTAQQKLNQIEKLPNYSVKEIKPDIYKITDKLTEKVMVKNITDVELKPKKYEQTDVNKLVIDMSTFDFNAYSDMYHKWSSVPLSAWKSLKAADANGNGKAEFYGYYRTWPARNYVTSRIYELGEDSTFNFVYEYQQDTIIYPYDIGDMDGDGNLDLVTEDLSHQIQFYTQTDKNSYINTPSYHYGFWNQQMQTNNVTFYDFDGDGTLEIVYNLDAGGEGEPWAYSNHVAKFNPVINNYEMVYYHQPPYWTWGLSVGDYDDDGLGNMAAGDNYGTVYMYEYDGVSSYNLQIIDTLNVMNAFLTTYSPDIDGNGKSELWIGGDSYGSITGGYTKIYVFEADSDNTYNVKFEVDILGLFSWSAGNMWTEDMDLDGIREVLLSTDAGIFVFKAVGINQYELFMAIPTPVVFEDGYLWPDGGNTYDLDSDGRPEIFISGDVHGNNLGYSQAIIYKTDFVTDVFDDDNSNIKSFHLNQNYPNPFNPTTKINYEVPKESFVNISVFNMLGEKLIDFVNKEQPKGDYNITFNGGGMPSGIYFIQMTAGKYRDVIKAVLLK